MIAQNELSAHDVCELMQETAQAHLALEISGYKKRWKSQVIKVVAKWCSMC